MTSFKHDQFQHVEFHDKINLRNQCNCWFNYKRNLLRCTITWT